MVRQAAVENKDRHSNDPKSSVRAPAKKEGGGGKYTLGKLGESSGGVTMDAGDPNYDPDERRIDPDDGLAYKYTELSEFYKGKFTKQAIAEYWDYECTQVVKQRGRKEKKKAEEPPAGPSLAESAAQAKATAKSKPKFRAVRNDSADDVADDVTADAALAQEVAAVIPYYPFKKLDKFYDVQGLLKHPNLLNAVCAVIAKRLRKLAITKLVAFEARGFLFTPVAIKTGLPFIMLRKKGKIPDAISSGEGADAVCVQRNAIVEGDKVVLLDDLMATGATFCAGIELVKSCKAEVVECTCMVELNQEPKGRDKCLQAGARSVWGFISEELLTKKADLPAGYVDDGL